jgi:hypothetical protein
MTKLDKLINYFYEKGMDEDIYIDTGEDHDGDHYIIFDGMESHDKFMGFAKTFLKLDPQETGDYELESILETNFVFSDEYALCSDCQSVIRTAPNSYEWTPDFYVGDGFIACSQCFANEQDYQIEYLEERINNPDKINQLLSDEELEKLGFVNYDDTFESGWHSHQTDVPQDIYKELSQKFEEVLFSIEFKSQFSISYSAWVRNEIEDLNFV